MVLTWAQVTLGNQYLEIFMVFATGGGVLLGQGCCSTPPSVQNGPPYQPRDLANPKCQRCQG